MDNYPFKQKVAACWNIENPYKPGENRTKVKLGNCSQEFKTSNKLSII